jgi:hypothetical protein
LARAGFAALLFAAFTAQAKPKPKPLVVSPQSFAVLGGSAVTLTSSTVVGDVGVNLGGAVTQTTSTNLGTVHVGDLAAQQAYANFLIEYVALGLLPCQQVISGNLAGQFLTPGVYCVEAASTTTGGTLTLVGSSTDTWIFIIGSSGSGALTSTDFHVVLTSGETCSTNVSWWVAQAATLTRSVFIGSLLVGADITVTGGSVGGQVLATGAVTLTGANIAVCGTPPNPPKPPKEEKDNEGIGNGEDGNTPGHDHNGGNDDAGCSPGKPGAKSKKHKSHPDD